MKATSRKASVLSEVSDDMAIMPKGKMSYFVEMSLLETHSFVLDLFLQKQKENPKFTRAHLARRIHKDPAQITRWLSNPSNWKNTTLHELLLGICGGKLAPSVTKYIDIAAPNFKQEDALTEAPTIGTWKDFGSTYSSKTTLSQTITMGDARA